ncbi:MAG TPA: aminopeptidase [Gaiellaceae bacterium]|nr:aminopeptidase [Gaiellaceae bacterium]
MTVHVPAAEAPFATPAELERYADAVVQSGLAARPGELVFVHAHPGHRAFVVALAEAAYRAGARHVEPLYDDPLVQAARIRHAAPEHLGPVPPWTVRRRRAQIRPDTGTIFVDGEVEPDALEGLPPDRVAEDFRRQVTATPWYLRAIQREERRATVAAWPTPAWAAQVYPEDDATEGPRKLLQDLLWFCRLGPDDPPGVEGWERHARTLRDRAARLTELELARVELRGPGTELSFGLSPRTQWLGGLDTGPDGREFAANMPTEETYTTPDFRRTEGTFRCSKPLSLHGRTVDGIAGEFRGGRLVGLEAATDDQREFLAAFLDTDAGARRVGELALVDATTSRIGRSGRVYENTLLDENAAAHFAFGFGFGVARERGDRAGARTVNRSSLHLDVMVGTDELEATGVRENGSRLSLIADGAWQLDD